MKMKVKSTLDSYFEKINNIFSDRKIIKRLKAANIKDIKALFELGIQFTQNGNHKIAIKIFDRITRLDRTCVEAWLNKGIEKGRLGKVDEELRCYDKAIKIRPNYAEAWNNKGAALGKLGKDEKAIKYFDRAIEIKPNYAEAWNNKGGVLGTLKKHIDSIYCFDKAIEIEPNYAEAWTNKGIALGMLKNYDKEINCYTNATKINPNDITAWYNKGVALAKLGNYDEAIICFNETLKLQPKHVGAWNNKGMALGKMGNYDEAIVCFNNLLKINPKDALALNNNGIALKNTGKYYEAMKCFNKAIRRKPDLAGAWSNKGLTLVDLGKNKRAIKCFNTSLKIDPHLFEAWSNKGLAFGNLQKYEEEIKCYDAAIRINPRDGSPWNNKGIALKNLGKPIDSIICYDEAIKINPNLDEAWYNKGISLAAIERFDEAANCFETATIINPNYTHSYGNWGIMLLNMHKYADAEIALKKAKELVLKEGNSNEDGILQKYILYTINAADLIAKLEPLDKYFLECLNSQSLVLLREKSLYISDGIQYVVKDFEKKNIPDDAKALLSSKAICFISLSNALRYVDVDLVKLSNTKDIFEKWGLDSFVIAVNSVDSFIRFLKKYKCIEDISKDKEVSLLRSLSPSHILDGELTQKITGQIKSELFQAKQASLEKPKEITKKYFPILSLTKDHVLVCLVQLDIRVSNKFPCQLENKQEVKDKILKALQIAKEKNVDIICFPELSFSEDFIQEIKQYTEMIIIGGSYYDKNNCNICPVIISGVVYPVYKIHPSPTLESEIAPGKGMRSGRDIKIFGTEDGKFKFCVLICIDFLYEGYLVHNFQFNERPGVNFLFNPSFNSDINRFQRRADSDCENYHVDIFQTNVKSYGGTCIIGIEHTAIIKRLVNEGFRQEDMIKYKLCEAINEMMILADLRVEGLKIPTPLSAEPRIKIFGRYKYENNNWKE